MHMLLAAFASAILAVSPSERLGRPLHVPPGGYAWGVFDSDAAEIELQPVTAFTSGPWTLLLADLPQGADSAIEMVHADLRDDLRARLADILYEVVDFDEPVIPFVTDLDGDGLQELIATDTAGSILAVFQWPELDSTRQSRLEPVLTPRADVTGDGLPDSVYFSGRNNLLISSEGRPELSISGFDSAGISGVALGDLEGDGIADLVMGTGSGRILIVENRGTSSDPCFVPCISDEYVAFPMNAGSFSSPSVTDISDGGFTVAVGTEMEGISIYDARITGGMDSIIWSDTVNTTGGGDLLNLSPVFIDADEWKTTLCSARDGSIYVLAPEMDSLYPSDLPPVPGTYADLALISGVRTQAECLLAGTGEGGVYTLEIPVAGACSDWVPVEGIAEIPSGAPAQWENGVVFGTEEGGLVYLLQDTDGNWIDSTDESPFRDLRPGSFSNPVIEDLDGDGRDEMLVGSADGRLTLYCLQQQQADDPSFVERYSWRFSPGGGVTGIEDYYARYFPAWTVLRIPSGTDAVNELSSEIRNAPQHLRDEIAYCISHTPSGVLLRMLNNGDGDLFRINAESIYEMARSLQYASLDDSMGVTTLSLKTENGWFAVDPEVYYDFVVHPRILFEVPARVNAEYWSVPRDSSLSYEDWLGHEPDDLFGGVDSSARFWRSFIPFDSCGSEPLIASMTDASTYEEAVVRICNFQSHSQPGGHMTFGYSTNDLQPMVIYRKAYGSCGEQSILQTALCRSFLVPAYVVGCRGEDHQWAHYLEPSSGRWDHWDINYGLVGIGGIWVSGEGVDHRGKTISTITAFGPDNSVWPVTRSAIASPESGYMPGDSGYTHTADVTVVVEDGSGRPVEGAMVMARSHWENANSVSQFEYSDRSGECHFDLGWEPNGGYTFDVVSPFGSAGSSNICFREDEDYRISYTLPCSAPDPLKVFMPPGVDPVEIPASLAIYPVSYYSRSLYTIRDGGEDPFPAYDWTLWKEEPVLTDLMFMDAENFRMYRSGENCRALCHPFAPEPGDTCYAVVDNRNSTFSWLTIDAPLPSIHQHSRCEDWLDGPVEERIPSIIPCMTTSLPESGPGNAGGIFVLDSLEIMADDPNDPLSASIVIGPLSVPPGVRNVEAAVSCEHPGADIDLFMFGDADGNLQVDGMEELLSRSATPTSSERINMGDFDAASVYWFYLQGWNIPGDSCIAKLSLSFQPEMINVHSLRPTGYLAASPDSLMFRLGDAFSNTDSILLVCGEDTLKLSAAGQIVEFPADKVPGAPDGDSVRISTMEGEPIGAVRWNISVDTLPPLFRSVNLLSDTVSMTGEISVRCLDVGSGIAGVEVSINGETAWSCRDRDTSWTLPVDLLEVSPGEAELEITVSDSAGNSILHLDTLPIPRIPGMIFRNLYPTGDCYLHLPIIQTRVITSDTVSTWTASAVLTDTAGSYRTELSPFAIDGDLLQFRPEQILPDGSYSMLVTLEDAGGEQCGECSWEFRIKRMQSTK